MDKDEAKWRVQEAVGRAKEVIAQGRAESLAETATREVFVTPCLAALGWDPLEDMVHEYRPKLAKTESVDYAIVLQGQPIAFVEAKRLGLPLTDEMAAQVIRYAAVEGVQWCILTNGVNWKLYDQFLKGDIHAKLVASLDLTAFRTGAEFDSVFDKLWFMSKQSLSDPSALKRWATLERLSQCLRTWLVDPASGAIRFLQGELAKADISVSDEEVARWFQSQLGAAPPPPPPSPEVTYWLFPAKGRADADAVTVLHEWLDRSMWGLYESTAGRKRVKAGDWVCFYAGNVGVVAYARVARTADAAVPSQEWPEPSPPLQPVYKLPLTDVRWLPEPVKLDERCRVALDAFKGKARDRAWGWFVHTTSKLTLHDFELLTGQPARGGALDAP